MSGKLYTGARLHRLHSVFYRLRTETAAGDKRTGVQAPTELKNAVRRRRGENFYPNRRAAGFAGRRNQPLLPLFKGLRRAVSGEF
jgi:hypothetical protein